MKQPVLVIIFLLIALSGWGIGYFGGKIFATQKNSHPSELEWLRSEFLLTDAQYKEIERLHVEYEPVCMDLCHRVVESQKKISRLIAAKQTMDAELEQAFQESAELRMQCQTATLRHVFRVSQCMSDEQGRRYVTVMGKHILGLTPSNLMFSNMNSAGVKP